MSDERDGTNAADAAGAAVWARVKVNLRAAATARLAGQRRCYDARWSWGSADAGCVMMRLVAAHAWLVVSPPPAVAAAAAVVAADEANARGERLSPSCESGARVSDANAAGARLPTLLVMALEPRPRSPVASSRHRQGSAQWSEQDGVSHTEREQLPRLRHTMMHKRDTQRCAPLPSADEACRAAADARAKVRATSGVQMRTMSQRHGQRRTRTVRYQHI